MDATCKDNSVVHRVISKLRDVYQDIKVTEGKVHSSYLGMTFDYTQRGK